MKATHFWLPAIALLVPGLAGCGGSSSSTDTSSPPVLVPRSVSAALSNGLTATLTEDRSVVSIGGAVNYTATLTNSTAQPITYQSVLSGTNSFSVPAGLVVGNPSGQTVYPLGAFAQYVAAGPSITLAPGQSVSGTLALRTASIPGVAVTQGYAAAGQYSATASFAVVPGTSFDLAQLIAVNVGPLPVTAQ